MIYTVLTKKAMKIAFEAHKEHIDKSGMPYIYHPIHLAEQMPDEATICVALLHDVIEDTDMTFEQLQAEGFTSEIIDALRIMTHDEKIPYLDYVAEIRKNAIATRVKLADLKHNSDLSRLDLVDDKSMIRVEKYRSAINLLINEH